MNNAVKATPEAKQLLLDWLEGIEISVEPQLSMVREPGGAWSIGTHEDPLISILFALTNHRHATLIAGGWAQEEPNNKLIELATALIGLEKYSDILDLDPSHAIPLAFVMDAKQSLTKSTMVTGAVNVSRVDSFRIASGYHQDYEIAVLLGVIAFVEQELACVYGSNPWGPNNG